MSKPWPDDTPKYGWRSAQATAEGVGTAFWRDENGTLHEVNGVSHDAECKGVYWADKEIIGKMKACARLGKPDRGQFDCTPVFAAARGY